MELDGKYGFADGIRADEDGNIWASAGWVGDGYDGVHIFAPNGDRNRLSCFFLSPLNISLFAKKQ